MFRRTISVRSPREASEQLAKFAADIRASDLPAPTVVYLEEQVTSTLSLFVRHHKAGDVTKYNANRVFDGDGFKVIVNAGSPPTGLFGMARKLLGLGSTTD